MTTALKGDFYSHLKALNAMAPQGSFESLSSFPKVINPLTDGQIKSIYVPDEGGDLTVTDLFGNQATFYAFAGNLDIPVKSIDSYTGASAIVLIYIV